MSAKTYPPEYLRQLLEIGVAEEGQKTAGYAALAQASGRKGDGAVRDWMSALVRELCREKLDLMDAEAVDPAPAVPAPTPRSPLGTFKAYRVSRQAGTLEAEIEEAVRYEDDEGALALFQKLQALDPQRARMFEMKLRLDSFDLPGAAIGRRPK